MRLHKRKREQNTQKMRNVILKCDRIVTPMQYSVIIENGSHKEYHVYPAQCWDSV